MSPGESVAFSWGGEKIKEERAKKKVNKIFSGSLSDKSDSLQITCISSSPRTAPTMQLKYEERERGAEWIKIKYTTKDGKRRREIKHFITLVKSS